MPHFARITSAFLPSRHRLRQRACRLLAASIMGCACAAAVAASYPDRPIRMMIPFPPGGPNDVLGRLLATEVGKDLGQPIVIENKGGAGGTIGADMVAKAAPDGYTLLLGGTASLGIAPSLYSRLPYDAVADFAPVGMVATSPSLLVVGARQPFRNVGELIARAKAAPGKLNFASAGVGTPTHLAAELFKTMAAVDIVHVPYKGGGPALNDLLAGQVEMYFSGIVAAVPLVNQGSLRALAITSDQRSELMPDVPTMSEAGLPGYEIQNWFAIFAPAGTPQPVVDRLNKSLARFLALPAVRSKMRELNVDPRSSTPQELAAYQGKELRKWSALVKQAGITPE
ncbi:MAG: tripartite tricarboxylate transporter substrate binding protein [Burkholderiales bacterium]|nr:tripartite tricarboxylate transporter substrate binding protein [Burkholderiales bacterium]